MNNKRIEQELLDINLYNELYYELQSLPFEKRTQANIRNELSSRMKLASDSFASSVAIIAAFYYYSLGKKELDFLQEYYHKTFSAYFNKKVINQYYKEIMKNEFLLNAVINICDSDIVSELYRLSGNNNPHDKRDGNYGEKQNDIVNEKKGKIQTTKVGTFSKSHFKNLTNRFNLRKLPVRLNFAKYFTTNETSYDKIASTDKQVIKTINENSINFEKTYYFVSNLDINIINGIKRSLGKIYDSYTEFKLGEASLEMADPKNNSMLTRLKAIGGTKVLTISKQKALS